MMSWQSRKDHVTLVDHQATLAEGAEEEEEVPLMTRMTYMTTSAV